MKYNFAKIEKKWQDKWTNEKSFKAIDFHPTKPKYYVLYEFYNISGNLHLGHLKGTVPADALARYKRFNGYNVLFPIGGDSFGLPAENAAIKHEINPADFVAEGMKRAMDQSKMIGLSCDWDRIICTSEPSYYKWTQWIFLQLFKHQKAYKQKGVVNFCPQCKTVLSNEDSQGGKCDRCGTNVVQEERWVWFLKMKEYSEKILNNIEEIQMSDSLKEAQRNWIGRSEGVSVTFDIVDKNKNKISKLDIFTTCIETIYGVTFVVLSPEHKLIDLLENQIENKDAVNEYRKATKYRTELDRKAEQKDKTGCLLKGLYAVNPVNGDKIPIYIADFVLASYGSGAVMAVPAHDQRDYEFAQKFEIPIKQVIEGNCNTCAVKKEEYLSTPSKMLNSQEFTGTEVNEAKKLITNKIIADGFGSMQVNYKMQDWSFNRQRYWGEPFPIILCDECGIVPVDEKDLPVELPYTKDYMPTTNGNSPLEKVIEWVECKCPSCGKNAKRETDTMPNWAGSSWYWLRYMDPNNPDKLADFEKIEYWGSVDCYTGGTEHITRHVLYAFFWQNFLYEIGAVPTRKPFVKKLGSGLILDDQRKKMSKSSTNGVSPIEVIEKYGADAARLHIHFLGGYEDSTQWTLKGMVGINSFLNRVWNLQNMIKGEEVSREHIYDLNKLIQKISNDIENVSLNTAIAAYMSFIKKIKADKFITREELRLFLILLNPLAPHITSEMFEILFNKPILDAVWPEYSEKYLVEKTIKMPIQINGKLVKVLEVANNISKEELLKEIQLKFPERFSFEPIKIIFVQNKIINLIKEGNK